MAQKVTGPPLLSQLNTATTTKMIRMIQARQGKQCSGSVTGRAVGVSMCCVVCAALHILALARGNNGGLKHKIYRAGLCPTRIEQLSCEFTGLDRLKIRNTVTEDQGFI